MRLRHADQVAGSAHDSAAASPRRDPPAVRRPRTRPAMSTHAPCRMQVIGLWRYPVKSLQGERLETAEVTTDGLAGDRRFAIFDTATGLGLTGRRMPELLFASARLRAGRQRPRSRCPDGSIADDDAALSRWLGRPVHLRSVDERGHAPVREPRGHGARDAVAGLHGCARVRSTTRPAIRVSLVSTTTLGSWDPRRFRSNVLLDGEGEDALVGETVRPGRGRAGRPQAGRTMRHDHPAAARRHRRGPRCAAHHRPRT